VDAWKALSCIAALSATRCFEPFDEDDWLGFIARKPGETR
jgi:hypothetical protein